MHSLTELIRHAKEKGDKKLFNNAAQHWNHSFFWQCLAAPEGQQPTGKLAAMIEEAFGSTEQLLARLKEEAVGHFASGWAWLVLNGGKLKITSLHDADTPVAHEGMKPLLTLDVWEHAYYIDYRNARPKFAEAVLGNIVNWEFVGRNLDGEGAARAEDQQRRALPASPRGRPAGPPCPARPRRAAAPVPIPDSRCRAREDKPRPPASARAAGATGGQAGFMRLRIVSASSQVSATGVCAKARKARSSADRIRVLVLDIAQIGENQHVGEAAADRGGRDGCPPRRSACERRPGRSFRTGSPAAAGGAGNVGRRRCRSAAAPGLVTYQACTGCRTRIRSRVRAA